MSDLGGNVEVAGKAIGGGLGFLAALQFIRWLFEWLGRRFDVRQARLDAQQQLVDGKVADRLRNLEQQVGVLERATTILLTELREIDPGNRRLAEVHNILHGAFAPPRGALPADQQAAIDKLGGVE